MAARKSGLFGTLPGEGIGVHKEIVSQMIIIEQEEPSFVHSDEHPFCSDPDCPCHNEEAVAEHIVPYLEDGTMSGAEALRKYWDQ